MTKPLSAFREYCTHTVNDKIPAMVRTFMASSCCVACSELQSRQLAADRRCGRRAGCRKQLTLLHVAAALVAILINSTPISVCNEGEKHYAHYLRLSVMCRCVSGDAADSIWRGFEVCVLVPDPLATSRAIGVYRRDIMRNAVQQDRCRKPGGGHGAWWRFRQKVVDCILPVAM
ncbi:hypothetical protein XENOCAPTIV_016822 [Xenoophorus captivus]|uniref:Uncharacterized protein n=1 Tax=Xenoophorus captivus TaxID=1517983 RepID=A0ABV0R0S3_9TELE